MKNLILTLTTIFLFQSSAFASFAKGTLISTPEGDLVVENFDVGSSISTRAGEGVVQLVLGTGNETHTMAFLQFQNGSELVVNLDQPLLLANGDFIQARKLIPGDKVLSLDGSVGVMSIAVGIYQGSVHILGLDRSLEDVSKNTYVANGIFVGDYNILLNCDQLCLER